LVATPLTFIRRPGRACARRWLGRSLVREIGSAECWVGLGSDQHGALDACTDHGRDG
jgi:hypothetical protein